MSKYRIGIDVGGTYTDAIAIDNDTYEIKGMLKLPTTHEEGVAVGIIKILNQLLETSNIAPESVVFIAHGTTQATNALLEGDVAKVGVVGMGTGFDARGARKETEVGSIELAPGKYLKTEHTFLDSAQLENDQIETAIHDLVGKQCEVIVASEAYSVDNPTNEMRVIEAARSQGKYATGGHEISELYGLKMRTRTAVVNASLIPRMIQTADMTEDAVKNSNIASSLMIMRCDGGVMNIEEMRKRPILTMLSGLAAGVAGALMYEKVSDGIFFEVGGTSIDISVIKNGKVMIKHAQVGGHKTYLRSLDVRTLAVAGGSMVRVKDGEIFDVGPRSAHIAGLEYECFTDIDNVSEGKVELISPRDDDPKEYAIFRNVANQAYSYTLAGAANILGYVPEDDYAFSNQDTTQAAWQHLADYVGMSIEDTARRVMDLANAKLNPVMNELIQEYELDRKFVTLVGGGGSASVVVPALAEHLNMQWKISDNAPYISTIGVALAMVREQIERTVLNPDENDILQIRQDVIEKIVQSGAQEETVDVNIEIDAQQNILRAVATGATEFRQKDLGAKNLSEDALIDIASQALFTDPKHVKAVHNVGRWSLMEATVETKKLFLTFKKQVCCVMDREGVVRFRNEKVSHLKFSKDKLQSQFLPFIDDNTIYSDANATIPKVFIFYREKMLDLTGMHNLEQLISIMDVELKILPEDEPILALAYQ